MVFLSRYSTVTNLFLALNNRQNVAIAYVDYAKAFDVVIHVKLLHKLSAYGITGDLLALIRAFLTGRSQCTRIYQSYSQRTYRKWCCSRNCSWTVIIFALYK